MVYVYVQVVCEKRNVFSRSSSGSDAFKWGERDESDPDPGPHAFFN